MEQLAVVVLVGFIVVVLSLTGIALALIASLRRAVHITNYGANAQTNVNGQTQTTSGGYTQVQVYEDAIAHLVQANDVLEALDTVLHAVQNGNCAGDPWAMLDDLTREAAHHGRYALFIVQQGRKGEYAFRTTEGEMKHAYRNGGSSGNGDRAA